MEIECTPLASKQTQIKVKMDGETVMSAISSLYAPSGFYGFYSPKIGIVVE